MNAVDAVRLRFIHQTAASSTEDPNEPCQGIMSDGSRCKHKPQSSLYGFRLCRMHRSRAAAWASRLSFDGKGEELLE
jgi:hypothetical protein